MSSVMRATRHLPADLPPGRPRLLRLPATRMLVTDTEAAIPALLAAAGGPGADLRVRRRHVAGRLTLGVPAPDGTGLPVETWEYGEVGAVLRPDTGDHHLAALRRFVQEQGYAVMPGGEEHVGPALLLVRLWRVY